MAGIPQWLGKFFTLDLPLIMTAAAALLGISTFVADLQRQPKGELSQRVAVLTKGLTDSTRLIQEIQTEIESRTALADKLQKDIKTYDELVKLKRPEVEAVAQLVRAELQGNESRSFWKDVGINFGVGLFFWLFA
jgi:hypothetical protein